MYFLCFLYINNICKWMCEMKLIFIVKCELRYKDSEFFTFQNWKVLHIHEDGFNTVTPGKPNFGT